MVLALALVLSDALTPVRAAHSNLQECALRIEAMATVSEAHTQFSYDIYRDRDGRFRIDLRPDTDSEYIFFTDGNRIILYERSRNVFVETPYTPERSPSQNVSATFGAAEPMMQVYLEPRNGLASFLRTWGASGFVRDAARQGEYVAKNATAPVRIFASRGTNLIESVIVGEADRAAKWQVKAAPLSLLEAIPWTPPQTAIQIESFAPNALPAPIVSPEAKPIIQRSREVYDNLSTIAFSSSSYLFTSDAEDQQSAHGWWERSGRLRVAATVSSANRSLEAFFDGATLRAYDKTSKKGYIGVIPSTEVVDVILQLGGPIEPLVATLATKKPFWNRFLQPGSNVTLETESDTGASILRITTFDGWTVRLTVRQDGLIGRIERSLSVDGKLSASETVLYSYHRVNEPIPAEDWTLPVPTETIFDPLILGDRNR